MSELVKNKIIFIFLPLTLGPISGILDGIGYTMQITPTEIDAILAEISADAYYEPTPGWSSPDTRYEQTHGMPRQPTCPDCGCELIISDNWEHREYCPQCDDELIE